MDNFDLNTKVDDIAVNVEGLGKRYALAARTGGAPVANYERFSEVLAGLVRASFRRKAGPDADTETGGFWALKDASFKLRRGETLGIIGRNGAGKSTLLKLLARVTEPSSGRAEINGRVAALLEVGAGFHPELTGKENIYLGGAILGMKAAEVRQRFDEIVDFAEVARFLDTPVKRYSSGMYLRLAFAVAAHLEPEILIIDEVLAVGDARFQAKCLNKIEGSAANGQTVIIVSHNLTAMRRLCRKCLVLTEGTASPIMGINEGIEYYNQSGLARDLDRIELSQKPRLGLLHGQAARIQALRLATAPLVYGEPGRIVVEFSTTRAVADFSVGLGIDTPDRQRLLTLDSDTHRAGLALAPGNHQLEIGLDFWPLHPGTYVVAVALHEGHHCLDIVVDAATWEVSLNHRDSVTDRGYGAVRPNPVVRLLPA